MYNGLVVVDQRSMSNQADNAVRNKSSNFGALLEFCVVAGRSRPKLLFQIRL
jgi:hypothetical protein